MKPDKDEIRIKVDRRLEVIHYYIFAELSSKKYGEFDIRDKKTRRDLNLLLALRKYLNIGKKRESVRKLFREIQEEADII